jgi:hypothetical protein
MNITPLIWQKIPTGDTLVFTGEPVTCSAAITCVASGSFTPDTPGNYFANATVLYTLPTSSTGVGTGEMNRVAIAPMSGVSTQVITALNVEGSDNTTLDYSASLLSDSYAAENALNFNPKNIDADASDVRASITSYLSSLKILQISAHGDPGVPQVSQKTMNFLWD